MNEWAEKLGSLFKRSAESVGRLARHETPRASSQPKPQGPRWAEDQAASKDHFDRGPDEIRRVGRAAPAKNAPQGGLGSARSRRGMVLPWIWIGAAGLLITGVAATVAVKTYVRPVPVAEEAKAGPDPLGPLSVETREALTKATPELGAELKRSFLGKPEDLCTKLEDLGLDNSGWRRAPFTQSRWQCASDLVLLTTPSVDFGPSTLFFLLRGPTAGKVDYLRLKLVVEDPRQKDIGLEAVWLVIGALADRYGWAVPSEFRNAVAGFQPLEINDRGIHLSVAPENPDLTGDALASQRLNIILNFGEPDLIRPAGRFEQGPPLEEAWRIRGRDGPGAE